MRSTSWQPFDEANAYARCPRVPREAQLCDAPFLHAGSRGRRGAWPLPVNADLERLGWRRVAAAFEQYAVDGLRPGRVALEHTHIYRVLTAEGEWLARVSGRLRHRAGSRVDFPAVGDWVALEPRAPGSDARIHAVLPRFSRFSRRAAGEPTEEQIVAANIDVVFIVTGLDHDFNLRRLERYLVVGRESGATPVIVLNKSDLVEDARVYVEQVAAVAPGVPVHAVSCRVASSVGTLRAHLGFGQTGALLGMSGVGKSSIVNELIGEELLPTRDVREWDSRGRHTTTARQLVLLPGTGVLIDTPGMRELQLWETSAGLEGTFGDIEQLASDCRFRDCRHEREPGCAVRAAVESGELSEARFASYQKLRQEQAFQARQQDQRAQIEEKRKARIAGKALNKRLKDKHGD
ncbi:MAG TPA: ribosome small subunit-dependent GTPase A [Vicinamibacterales bacterium]|nr:ribosome small subunit-dependent GTPase A [Vicinamibacterales bacterium]